MTANVFVFGLDDFNLAQLRALPHADQYRFHELYRHDEVKAAPEFPVEALLHGARERLDAFPERITVDFPFWIKPVKSAGSYLGFKVRHARDLDEALTRIREGIGRFARPFNYLLQFAQLPPEVAGVNGNHCIVEEIISHGRQCTLEGWVHGGKIEVYGVVDSIREGRYRSSFARYQYPSRLPRRVRRRMVEATHRFLSHIGYDNAPFNIEFYWNEDHDTIHLLEVNARISKSHAPLFQQVDGVSHHQVMLDLALGRQPDFPHRQGAHKRAAKFMWRATRDAAVRKAPSPERAEELCDHGVQVELHVREGMRLSDLTDQDSYSYEIAVMFIGADSQPELVERYRRCKDRLGLELEPLP